jgi:hypothetical protein
MDYPETLVISVTSHGVIQTNINNNNINEPLTFNIPPDMSIIKLSAVAPGVCNLTYPSDIDEFIKKVIKKVNNPVEYQKLISDPTSYVESLAELYKNIEEDTVKQTINEKELDYEEKIRDDYVHHRNKSYTIKTYNSNNPIINKEYVRNNRTELNVSEWEFQINVLNTIGIPDLFREMLGRSYKDANSSITLQGIVEFVKSKGGRNIILLDLSCSNFESTDPSVTITDRQERAIRRDILKKGLNGGKMNNKSNKTKKTNNKRKTKKNKKTKKYNKNRKTKIRGVKNNNRKI